MTFRVADPDALYRVAVPIDVPGEDGPVRHECTLAFRLLDAPATEKLVLETDRAYVAGVVAGWEGIEGADGKPLAFSEENLALLADIPYFARAVVLEHSRWQMGLPGKTSATPRSTGSAGNGAETR